MNHYRGIVEWQKLRIVLVLGIVISAVPTMVLAAPASTGPTLRFVTAAGFRLGIAGAHWPKSAHVVFSVQEGSVAAGTQLRVGKSGSFTIGINNIDVCARPTFKARDLIGHRATLRGPALGCPTRADPSVPRLRVLVSKATVPQVTRIFGVQPRSVSLHVGDELYIWEQGTTLPAFRPHVPLTHLFLTSKGVTPPRMCAQPDCDTGMYWQYAAVSSGEAIIDMSPGCRDVTPRCGAPDLALTITIFPSGSTPMRRFSGGMELAIRASPRS